MAVLSSTAPVTSSPLTFWKTPTRSVVVAPYLLCSDSSSSPAMAAWRSSSLNPKKSSWTRKRRPACRSTSAWPWLSVPMGNRSFHSPLLPLSKRTGALKRSDTSRRSLPLQAVQKLLHRRGVRYVVVWLQCVAELAQRGGLIGPAKRCPDVRVVTEAADGISSQCRTLFQITFVRGRQIRPAMLHRPHPELQTLGDRTDT